MKIYMLKLVDRWDKLMNSIGCEHITINTKLSELEVDKKYYNTENGITVKWMLKEAKYWLSCYIEAGNSRYDDRKMGVEAYKLWVSDRAKLARMVVKLERMEDAVVVEW